MKRTLRSAIGPPNRQRNRSEKQLHNKTISSFKATLYCEVMSIKLSLLFEWVQFEKKRIDDDSFVNVVPHAT
jgi:hypothetical protein